MLPHRLREMAQALARNVVGRGPSSGMVLGPVWAIVQRLLLQMIVLAVATTAAHAGFTSPTLVLSAARGEAGTSGRGAAFEGSFDFPNAVEVGYPLSLVVFQGTTFARYPAAAAPVTGTSAALGDGVLDETELAAFTNAGAAADASVRIVTMTPSAIRVTLPATFTSGPASAELFTILSDGSVVSNVVAFVLP